MAPQHTTNEIKIMQNATKVKILNVASFKPEQIVSSIDLFDEIKSESQYGVSKDWMIESMGIEERRVSEDMLPSELAIAAAQQAIEGSGLKIKDIDAVIFCGIERDRPEPATAHTIANELGINSAHSFDVSNACFGFFEGVMIADSYIKSGMCENALVCTGEIGSHVLKQITKRLKEGVSIEQFQKQIGALSVGDAGGAVVMSKSDDESGFEAFRTLTKTQYLNYCFYKTTKKGLEGQMMMTQLAIAMIRAHQELWKKTQLLTEKPKFLLSHQVGKRPYEWLSGWLLEEPQNHMKTFDRFGNTASASFALGFERLINCDSISNNDCVVGCFNGSGAVAGQFIYTI